MDQTLLYLWTERRFNEINTKSYKSKYQSIYKNEIFETYFVRDGGGGGGFGANRADGRAARAG